MMGIINHRPMNLIACIQYVSKMSCSIIHLSVTGASISHSIASGHSNASKTIKETRFGSLLSQDFKDNRFPKSVLNESTRLKASSTRSININRSSVASSVSIDRRLSHSASSYKHLGSLSSIENSWTKVFSRSIQSLCSASSVDDASYDIINRDEADSDVMNCGIEEDMVKLAVPIGCTFNMNCSTMWRLFKVDYNEISHRIIVSSYHRINPSSYFMPNSSPLYISLTTIHCQSHKHSKDLACNWFDVILIWGQDMLHCAITAASLRHLVPIIRQTFLYYARVDCIEYFSEQRWTVYCSVMFCGVAVKRTEHFIVKLHDRVLVTGHRLSYFRPSFGMHEQHWAASKAEELFCCSTVVQ